MAQGKMRDESKERQWQRWIQQWPASGLSMRGYCEWLGVSVQCFYRRRRVLGQRGRLRQAGAPSLPLFVPVETESVIMTSPIERRCQRDCGLFLLAQQLQDACSGQGRR